MLRYGSLGVIVNAVSEGIRDNPDETFIALMQRYDIEPEIARVLDAKLRRRAGAGYMALPIEALASSIEALIRSQIGNHFRLSNARWLTGGASKLQVAFDLEWEGSDGVMPQMSRMVLRMEPPASTVETSRRREFEVLKAVTGEVPTPRCYWVDAEAEYLPYPGLIYEWVPGVTKPSSRPVHRVSGVGINFGPELRPVLGAQFIDNLASIHTLSADRVASLKSFTPALIGSRAHLWRQINWWRRVWEEDRLEPLPLIDVAARWLTDNAPPLDHVSIVHGDYRAGNFLYDEAERRITAVLDWELAVIGDRHQDLAWLLGPHFGHYAEDGKTFLACGLLPPDDILRRYETRSGLPVDLDRMLYFRVFNDYVGVVHMLASAVRVARHSKGHQDVVVAWVAMIGHMIAGGLRTTLEGLL